MLVMGRIRKKYLGHDRALVEQPGYLSGSSVCPSNLLLLSVLFWPCKGHVLHLLLMWAAALCSCSGGLTRRQTRLHQAFRNLVANMPGVDVAPELADQILAETPRTTKKGKKGRGVQRSLSTPSLKRNGTVAALQASAGVCCAGLGSFAFLEAVWVCVR